MSFYWSFTTLGLTYFNGRLACWPIKPNSVRIVAGSNVLVDDGNGNFTGDGVGTIDYDYGFFSLAFSSMPPSGTQIFAFYESVEGGCADDCNKCKTHRLKLDITPGAISGQSQLEISDAWVRLFEKINRDVKPIHVELYVENYEENYNLSIGHRFDIIPSDEEPLDTGGLHTLFDDSSW